MKAVICLFAILSAMPTWAAISIDSNGIRINTQDEREVNKWKEKHRNDCSSVKIGDLILKSDGCDSTGTKSNRSVHGDNNPGKGHDKPKPKPKKHQ